MIVAVVGIGLIGGSIAKDLKSTGFSNHIIGIESNEQHAKTAIEIGLVDEVLFLEDAIEKSDLIILATPVEVTKKLIVFILDRIASRIVIDVCSTKQSITQLVKDHPKRGRYVAAHPMAGTEYSGPDAALSGLFVNKTNIICERERSDYDALEIVLALFEHLKMNTSFLNSNEHDIHAANVSHLSHISSFALALSVLEIEKSNTDEIKIMAAGGFRSTVRLAKSDARTWEEILLDNAENVLTALEVYAFQLEKFRKVLISKDKEQLQALIVASNEIGPIVDAISKTAEERI